MATKHWALAAAAMGVVGTASASWATLLVEEPFGRGPGANVVSNATATDSGSFGLQYSYYQVVNTQGTATTVAPLTSPVPDRPANGYALNTTTNGGSGIDIFNTFNPSVTVVMPSDSNTSTLAPASVYISYIVDYQTLFTSSAGYTGSTASVSNVQLMLTSTTASAATLNFGYNGSKGTVDGGAHFGMNIANAGAGAPTGFNESTTGATVATNTPTLVVLELDYRGGAGNDSIEMYIDPTSGSSPVNQRYSGFAIPMVTGYQFASSAGVGTSTDYDEFRVATTFADVLTPEPATLSLLGLGAMGLLKRRRRSPQ